MLAISLWQPWATLVAIGAKQFETRSWWTPHRGILVIHASKKWTYDLAKLSKTEPFSSRLTEHGYFINIPLPFGAYVAVAELAEVYRTEEIKESLSEQEVAFGDYSQGRFAWQLKNIRHIEPIPARGYQKLWAPVEGVERIFTQKLREVLTDEEVKRFYI